MRFTWLTGDIDWMAYGAKWVSKKMNNGDFDYAIVMELTNMFDAVGEEEIKQSDNTDKYHVTLSVVAPSELTDYHKTLCDDGNFEDHTWEWQVEFASSEGIEAKVFGESSNNARELMKQARKEAEKIELLFGFYMDRPQNAIGSNGWDFIKGDVMAGLQRQTA